MRVHEDKLTGLPTRPGLEEAAKQAMRAEEAVSLATLDVDNFMRINVDFEHATGDRVLQLLAALMEEVVPGGGYRISGDEFTVLMPGLTLEQAFLKMETLRTRVAGATERFALPDGRPVTVTVGVAQYPRDARDFEGLSQAASAALSAAKEAGRNQVGLPPNEEMVMKSCYYASGSIRRLKALAERLGVKESKLLRTALEDLLRKHDQV